MASLATRISRSVSGASPGITRHAPAPSPNRMAVSLTRGSRAITRVMVSAATTSVGPHCSHIRPASSKPNNPATLGRCKSKAGIPGALSRFWTSAETPGNCRCGVPVQAMIAPSLFAPIPASRKHACDARSARSQTVSPASTTRRVRMPHTLTIHSGLICNSAASVSFFSTLAGRKWPNPARAGI